MNPLHRMADWFAERPKASLALSLTWPLLIATLYAAFIYGVTV